MAFGFSEAGYVRSTWAKYWPLISQPEVIVQLCAARPARLQGMPVRSQLVVTTSKGRVLLTRLLQRQISYFQVKSSQTDARKSLPKAFFAQTRLWCVGLGRHSPLGLHNPTQSSPVPSPTETTSCRPQAVISPYPITDTVNKPGSGFFQLLYPRREAFLQAKR